MTNFHLSLKDLEALSRFGQGDMSRDELVALLDIAKRGREWLGEFEKRPMKNLAGVQ
jgi:hypothetical protein